jgi:predicted amidohydrolase
MRNGLFRPSSVIYMFGKNPTLMNGIKARRNEVKQNLGGNAMPWSDCLLKIKVCFAFHLLLAFFVGSLAVVVRAADETAAPKTLDGRDTAQAEPLRVAGVVLKWLRAEKELNYMRAERLITQAARGGAKLVCTTECFLDGYAIKDKSIPIDEYLDLGEPIPDGPYFQRLTNLADRLDIYLIAGMLEADGPRRYNTAVLIDPHGRLVGRYRKHRLEHELVRNTPGTETPVFETSFGRVGIMICADRRDAGLVRRIRDGGADLLICPSGGMFGPKVNDPILQARSKENKTPIVFVHPAEFLVTSADGEIIVRKVLGDQLEITTSEVGGRNDLNGVFFVDLSQFLGFHLPKDTRTTK